MFSYTNTQKRNTCTHKKEEERCMHTATVTINLTTTNINIIQATAPSSAHINLCGYIGTNEYMSLLYILDISWRTWSDGSRHTVFIADIRSHLFIC